MGVIPARSELRSKRFPPALAVNQQGEAQHLAFAEKAAAYRKFGKFWRQLGDVNQVFDKHIKSSSNYTGEGGARREQLQ